MQEFLEPKENSVTREQRVKSILKAVKKLYWIAE